MRKLLVIISVLTPLLFTSALYSQGRGHDRDRDRGDWSYNGDYNWDQSWNSRPNPRAGACFYTTAGYTGNHFCVRSGDRLPHLPGNFGDNISAVQIFGRGGVTVFNDRNFSGGSAKFRSSIPDLRERRFRGGHTWNNRISSIIVR